MQITMQINTNKNKAVRSCRNDKCSPNIGVPSCGSFKSSIVGDLFLSFKTPFFTHQKLNLANTVLEALKKTFKKYSTRSDAR